MKQTHSVIVIPGLGDNSNYIKLLTKSWNKCGLDIIAYPIGWNDGTREFQPKLDKLLRLIDKLHAAGEMVSIVGTSAGGSAALNAFVGRKNIIHKVVNVCGRLRVGPESGFWSFVLRTKQSPSFANSVRMFESKESLLTENDRKRIMTIMPLFGDQLVPASTVPIEGALNKKIFMGEHILSIATAMTIYSPLKKFLLSN